MGVFPHTTAAKGYDVVRKCLSETPVIASYFSKSRFSTDDFCLSVYLGSEAQEIGWLVCMYNIINFEALRLVPFNRIHSWYMYVVP